MRNSIKPYRLNSDTVCVRLPHDMYDEIVTKACKVELSLSAYIRMILKEHIKDTESANS